MAADTDLAEVFEAHRDRLTGIAARVLGGRADAEDVVQEAWVRLARQEAGAIDNVAGWLTTVVGRLCVDQLRSRAARPETPFGPGLVVTEDDDRAVRPEDSAVQADAVGLALLVVLGALGPDERLAFVLHDLFAVPFAEIGPVLGKSADAAKMAASRARRKVRGAAPEVSAADRREQRAVVNAFLAAAREGRFDDLVEILDPGVVWEVRTAAGTTVHRGVDELLRVARRGDPTRFALRRVLVDGRPGILVRGPNGRPVGVMACTVRQGRMTRVVSVLGPGPLAGLDLPLP
ncbi:sigma-70 family RNA polymerase sigma factor [Actinokineospora sp. G85]|uniref:sigma-70 family RNA polymerase sigma factor n=1 Tax=Actinokineospora sp. G85 TaxID=3406626 RepID=UPI003C77518D